MVLFSGCYSLYSINENEIINMGVEENIEIELNSGEKIWIQEVQKTKIFENQDIEFIQNDSTHSVFSLNNLKGIAVERFDYPKTILTSLFIVIGFLLINGGIGSPGG